MSGLQAGMPRYLYQTTATTTATATTASWWTSTNNYRQQLGLGGTAPYLQQAQQLMMYQAQALVQPSPSPPPAPRPPWNRYLAGSDLLEDFIRYCAPHGVTKRDFRQLPLELFIQWLVLEAARVDEEDLSELPNPAAGLLAITHQPRPMTHADLWPA